MTFKEKYIKLLADHISVSVEDLSEDELSIMIKSFDLFESKLEDIKILQDENKILSIKLANLKSSLDNDDYHYDEDEFHDSHDEHLDNDIDK